MRCLNGIVQVTSASVSVGMACVILLSLLMLLYLSSAHIRRWPSYGSLSDSWFHFLKKLIKTSNRTPIQHVAI